MEVENESSFMRSLSPWAKRFVAAAIIQGAIIVGLTGFIVLGEISFLTPGVSRAVAAGGAGTWFTFGYLIYISVGVISVAVSSIFYHVIRIDALRGSRVFAWVHLILMNVGISAAAGLMMYAGYIGGAAALPTAVGGQGLSPGQVHELIGGFVQPIGV